MISLLLPVKKKLRIPFLGGKDRDFEEKIINVLSRSEKACTIVGIPEPDIDTS